MSADPETVAYGRRVEAILFAAAEPLAPDDIRAHAGEGDLGAALDALVADYAARGINLVERGGHWLFQTAPDCAPFLTAAERPRRLSRAALETLAVIAYHEPATRAEVEAVRGVATAPGTLDALLESGMVAPAGRRETPGRPMQYATTPAFLAHFNLKSLSDLPRLDELKAAGLLSASVPERTDPPVDRTLAPDDRTD